MAKGCTPIAPNFKAPVLPKRWGSNNSDRAPKVPNLFIISIKPLSQIPDMRLWIDYVTFYTKIVSSFTVNHLKNDSFFPLWAIAVFWPESSQNFFVLIKNPFLTNHKSIFFYLKTMSEFLRQFWLIILFLKFNHVLGIKKYRPKTSKKLCRKSWNHSKKGIRNFWNNAF